jgi:hypothetical protein
LAHIGAIGWLSFVQYRLDMVTKHSNTLRLSRE